MTTPLEELERLEVRRTELGRDRSRLEARTRDIERERADLEARAARSADVDELRKLREQLTELELEAQVIENRTPAIERQLRQLTPEIFAVSAKAHRYRVCGLIVDADPILQRILTLIDELGVLRQRAVADGVPSTLLAPPPGESVPDSHGDVVAFTLADRLAVHLRGAWRETIVPEARRDAD